MSLLTRTSRSHSPSTHSSARHRQFTRALLALGAVLAATGCGSGLVEIASAASPATTIASTTAATASTGASTAPVTGAVLTPGPIAFPSGFMKSVKDYGAAGDGFTDDTAALQAALSDGRSNAAANYNGVPKGLYFPPGTYLIHDTLVWNGCCVTLQGSGSSASVIRLTPSAPGFGSATTPKPMIQTPAGNTSFRQDIWDLGFSVGAANAGAVGIDYVSNNTGSIRNVQVLSEDGGGAVGVTLTRFYAGPLLIKNLSVTGFAYGLNTAAYEYGQTLEGITLQHQTVAGIYNKQQTISVRNLHSINSVPAVVNDGGIVLVLDAILGGGVSGANAIQNHGGLYARDVTASGYGATLADTSGSQPITVNGKLTEYVVGTPQTLRGGSNAISLNLPVAETPSYVDTNLAKWAAFTPSFYGDSKSLQTTMNSGASTIYFPFTEYLAYNEVVINVPDTVKRIVGFSSVVNSSPSGTNGGGIRFVVNSQSTQPLIVEQFGYGVKVEHHGQRPVVLKSGKFNYSSFPGAGNVFLEDVITDQLVFQAGQQVWARQLNDEVTGTKITNNGTLWVLGLKTENDGTVIDTAATGKTEVLGNLIYPAQGVASNSILFRSASQSVSYIYSQSSYCPICGYATQVAETISGVTLEVTANPARRYVMALYHGQ